LFCGDAEFSTDVHVDAFVAWRRRGIGQAMTASALHAAQDCGARRAFLDASATGAGLYLRLGFEDVARAKRFFPAG